MKLKNAKKLALELMKEYKNIMPTNGRAKWTFKFDKAKRRFGCCNYRNNTISLSRELTELNTEEKVKDTLLHEIAHGILGAGYGHNKLWKSTAMSIGCDGERCYSGAINEPKPIMIRYCETCGFEQKYYKRNYGKKISCGKCCKIYNEKYLLKIKKRGGVKK